MKVFCGPGAALVGDRAPERTVLATGPSRTGGSGSGRARTGGSGGGRAAERTVLGKAGPFWRRPVARTVRSGDRAPPERAVDFLYKT